MENGNIPVNRTLTIFLVDDDQEDQGTFIDAISEIDLPIELILFDTGEELFNALVNKEKFPDALFLDLYMPKMDGEACLAKLREDEAYKEVPIVIYSTEFDISRIEELFALGANRYLRKPAAYDSLVKSLEIVVSSVYRNAQGGISVINIT